MAYQQSQPYSPYPTQQQPQANSTQQPPFYSMSFTDNPMSIACPHCHASIVTRTVHKNGVLTWIAVGGLCLIGCWLGCQLIPLCMDSLKDVEHYCPNCNALIGVHKKV